MPHVRFVPSWLIWIALLLVAASGRAEERGESAAFEALRAGDMRLATTGFRLSTANAALCDRLEPGIGIQVHTLDQYAPALRPAVIAHFGFAGPVAVAGVVEGSPAERAGVRADDSIVAIAGIRFAPQGDGPPSTDRLVTLWRQLAQLPPDRPVQIELLRRGRPLTLTIRPVAACRTRYELAIDPALDARANGEMVRISSGYDERFGAELVPVAVAHELAHNILHHRDRLKAAGAAFGMLSGFGRNADLFLQTEIEADALSVHLLARAGYPRDLASRFWQHPAAQTMSGTFRARTHPHRRERLKIMLAQEAKIAAAGANLPPAPFVAGRDAPLTGEWRPLIPAS